MTIKELVESKHPAQVMFYDGQNMCAGIMLGDKIICACCGGVFEVEEVIEDAKIDGVEAIRMFEVWIDVSNEIKGSEADTATAIALENGGYV